ncbi:MAG: FliH/SctL family protein [Bacillota bacterium]|nr:FliH/SctL family protein [Bacillota bacterium]
MSRLLKSAGLSTRRATSALWEDLPPESRPAAEPEPAATAGRGPAEELAEARRSAEAEGYADGFRRGLEEGRAAGREEGRRQGYEEGYQAAMADAAERAAALAAEAEDLLARAEAAAAAELEAVPAGVAALAVEVGARLLRRELQAEPEALVAMVRGILAEAGPRSRARILASRSDRAILEASLQGLGAALPGVELEVAEDERLGPLDLRVETEAGDFDATLLRQIAALRRRIEEALRHG